MEINGIQDVRKWDGMGWGNCEPLLSDSQLAQSDSLLSNYKKVAELPRSWGEGAQTPRNEEILPTEGVRFLVT